MAGKLNFDGESSNMVKKVLTKADETNLDHKKRDIPLDQIDMFKDNEYIFGYKDIEFLAANIKERGFHGAIEVYAKPNGRYEIMSGHRRYLACQQLDYETIPCIVSEDQGDSTIAEQIIMSNIHQRNLSPLRLARALDYYDKHVLSVDKKFQGNKRTALAQKFNISESKVQRHLVLLKLIPELQKLCDDISFPFSYLIPAAEEPENIQRKLYDRLSQIASQIAPDGRISDLSKAMVEQQLESIKLAEKRSQEAQHRREEQADTNRITETDKKPAPMPAAPEKQTADDPDIHQGTENSGFVSYSNATNEMRDLGSQSPGTDDSYQVPSIVPEDKAVDNEVMFYINKIDDLTPENAVFEDKDRVVDMLNQLIKKLKK